MVMRCWFLRKYYYLYIFIFCEKCFNLLRVKLVYVKVVEPVVLEAGAGVAIEDNTMLKSEKYTVFLNFLWEFTWCPLLLLR